NGATAVNGDVGSNHGQGIRPVIVVVHIRKRVSRLRQVDEVIGGVGVLISGDDVVAQALHVTSVVERDGWQRSRSQAVFQELQPWKEPGLALTHPGADPLGGCGLLLAMGAEQLQQGTKHDSPWGLQEEAVSTGFIALGDRTEQRNANSLLKPRWTCSDVDQD